ncbi:gremlin-2-like [Xenentodon cancila]
MRHAQDDVKLRKFITFYTFIGERRARTNLRILQITVCCHGNRNLEADARTTKGGQSPLTTSSAHYYPAAHGGERMLWKITIPIILAGVLCMTTETKKTRPQGSIPSPYKTKGNLSAERHHRLLQQKPEVLSSSHEALVVTERRYLRRDWCKTQPLRQTISEEGCRSRTVVNRFCYGQCNSFYIPRHMGPGSSRRQKRGQASGSGRKSHNKAQEPFQSCSFCRPHRITQLTVQLDCPDLQPPFRHRKVQRVKQCRCMSVDVSSHGKL